MRQVRRERNLQAMKRVAGVAAFAAVMALIGIGNFSEVASRYRCSGTFASDTHPTDSTIFLKMVEYRWWVGLWSDSDGHIWLEAPGRSVEYFPRLQEIDSLDQFRIMSNQMQLQGDFSTLSGRLYLETSLGTFGGTCTPAD